MRDEGTQENRDAATGRDGEPAGPAAAPPALSEAERKKILYEWNETHAEYPDACVHELFERQVDRDPDAVAVVFKERRMSYRELNQRANQVAHYLRKQGVGPETLVGVSLERCPELVIGLLGVWKAGGAYVPLDPAYPQERLSFMVEDSGIRMLLTEEKCKPLFPSAGDRTVCLDSEWSTFEHEGTDNPGPSAVPSNLAYVMYTSGSTGRPKGAMILHGGLVNYLTWAIRAYGAVAGGSVPVHTSVSFDLTVTSLYPALLAGGHAELIPEDVAAQNLLAALRQDRDRNLVKITPAHLDLLGQQLGPEEVAGLTRLFVIGGENLTAESLQLWREHSPDTRLINEYGPTETVVGCCVYEVQAGDPPNGSVPIGRPIANTQLYVLDPDLQPVALGVMGELYIGGAGVARGYLNRPELTKERFLADPFSGMAGARLYKTGDLARYRADGILEYLGRVDNQVKVRGYRIELGEVEATLAGHPAVQSCVVLALEETPGNRQLVGYVVPRPGQAPRVEELHAFVGQRLPDYMTPPRFVVLRSFPLTDNGKVDRKALPAFAASAAPPELRAPRTPTERALTEIWQQILHRERVGTRDDFFDIGGHSLLMLKMVSEIGHRMGVELPLTSILTNTTIEALAAAIDGLRQPTPEPHQEPRLEPSPEPPVGLRAEPVSGLTELKAGGPRCLFFVFDGDGELLPYLNIARRMPTEFAVYGISPFQLPGIPLGHLTIPEMARHCVDRIQRRQPQGPYFLGGLCAGGEIAFEAVRQLEQDGKAAGMLLLLDAVMPTTPTHPWLDARRRWQRFTALFHGTREVQPHQTTPVDGPSPLRRSILAQAAAKVWNAGRYEAVRAIRAVWTAARQQVLRYVLAREVDWPRWLPSLTVRQIYDFRARATYRPGVVSSPVVLVRAGGGEDSNESSRDLVADPFLGWKAYAGGRFEVIDAPGGHSGMLQEPHVDVLSRELVQLLKSTPQGEASRN